MTRLFAYYRVSTLQQEKEKTVKRQERIISDEVKRFNYIIIKDYRDLSFSGKVDSRPAYNEMIQTVKERNDIEGIIVSELSRFGRGGIRTAADVVDLNDVGKVLIAPNSNFDSRTREGKITLAVAALLADLEHDDLVDRLAIGRQLYVEDGGLLGRTPLTIPKAELEMLLMANGSYSSIAEMYKKRNVKNRPSNRKTVARIAKEHNLEHLNRWLKVEEEP